MNKILFFVLAVMLSPDLFGQHHTCGNSYFNSKKRLKDLKSFWKFAEFKPGDTIASVGAANGWYEAAISVYYDDLTFYLEDIDSSCLNEGNLREVVSLYSGIKGVELKNTFIPIIGADSATKLPAVVYDKILLNNVYHHIEKKKQMLSDLKRISRPNTSVYVLENLIKKGQETQFNCRYYSDPEDIVHEFKAAGFEYIARYGKWGICFLQFKAN